MRGLAFLLSVSVVAACAAPVPEADITQGQIRADMREYAMGLTAAEVRAGTVTFIARNAGSTAHDLHVIKTDLAADKLPIDTQTQKAKEDGKVGGVDQIAPGKSQNLRLELPAGSYVVICNVPTHYQLGMRSALTVK
ncbi:MAG: hypothetical protein HYY42_05360 [Chloroflexi bacterium]|nr:hypothetical protein [Chloroflexota bacterium]